MTWTVEVDDFRQLVSAVGDYLLSLSGYIVLVVLLVLFSGLIRRRFRLLAERRRMHRSIPALFDNAVQALVYVIIGFIVLAALGVNTRSLATFAGLVTAALTLSVQDVLKNIFCGFYLLGERPFAAGDRIRIGAEDGYVERIDLRVTRVRNDRQELVLVPNSVFFSQITVARSTMQRRSLTIQLAGIEETRELAGDQVRAAIADVASADSQPTLRLLQIGPAGCDFEVTVSRVETQDQQRIIAALNDTFPAATLTVVGR
jgi:small-conductance mechanosensitive channel